MPAMTWHARTLFSVVLSLCVSAALAPSASAAPDARSSAVRAFTVTATSQDDTLNIGKRAVIKGKVTPRRPGDKVLLQVRDRKKWDVIERTRLNAKSAYKFAVRPNSAGLNKYRVVKRADRRIGSGVSNVIGLRVYRWIYLYDRDAVDDYYVHYHSSAYINGTSYRKTLNLYGDESYVEYNTYRKCTDLRLTAGLLDDHSSNDGPGDPARSHLEIFADSASIFDKEYTLGQSDSLTLPIDDVLRIRFAVTYGGGYPEMGLGTPQVRCSF